MIKTFSLHCVKPTHPILWQDGFSDLRCAHWPQMLLMPNVWRILTFYSMCYMSSGVQGLGGLYVERSVPNFTSECLKVSCFSAKRQNHIYFYILKYKTSNASVVVFLQKLKES
jgi:hypothetical protein